MRSLGARATTRWIQRQLNNRSLDHSKIADQVEREERRLAMNSQRFTFAVFVVLGLAPSQYAAASCQSMLEVTYTCLPGALRSVETWSCSEAILTVSENAEIRINIIQDQELTDFRNSCRSGVRIGEELSLIWSTIHRDNLFEEFSCNQRTGMCESNRRDNQHLSTQTSGLISNRRQSIWVSS